MALLQLNDFANLLDYFQVTMDIDYFQADSGRTGAGEDLITDMADPIWRGEIVLDQRLSHAKAIQAQALVALLDGAIGRFLMADPRLPMPQADPKGTILGSATVTVLDINADRTTMRLTGLPNGYPLTLGDRLHIPYGSNPARRTYHYICQSLAAGTGGNTASFAVKPNIPVGVAIGDTVTLKNPSPFWRMVSGTKKPGAGQGKMTPGPSWQIIQAFSA